MNTKAMHTEAVLLKGAQRLTFLPALFGRDFVMSESSVYGYATKYIDNYQGGSWEFYRLPGGGGFMVPEMDSAFFCNPHNGFECELSAEAAGIIITALVLSHRTFVHHHHDQEELCHLFCQRYGQLMAWAETHFEADYIFRALGW